MIGAFILCVIGIVYAIASSTRSSSSEKGKQKLRATFALVRESASALLPSLCSKLASPSWNRSCAHQSPHAAREADRKMLTVGRVLFGDEDMYPIPMSDVQKALIARIEFVGLI